jgi:hypothetical protein
MWAINQSINQHVHDWRAKMWGINQSIHQSINQSMVQKPNV